VPVQHALNLVVAAQQHKLAVQPHVFPRAKHGFALRGLARTQDNQPTLAARWITAKLRG
jgi:dipeptidyl aminopeptidase/acylaminoacyl peptidase